MVEKKATTVCVFMSANSTCKVVQVKMLYFTIVYMTYIMQVLGPFIVH